MSNDSFDKGFRDKLGYFSADPPINMWEDIEKELDRKENKKAIFILTRIAAVLLPLAALLIGLRQIHKQPSLENNAPIISETKGYTEEYDTLKYNTPVNSNIAQEELKSVNKKNVFHSRFQDTSFSDNSLLAKVSSNNPGCKPYIDSNKNSEGQLTYLPILEPTILPDTPVLIASILPLNEPVSQQELHENAIQAIEQKKTSQPTKIQLGVTGGPQYTSGIQENVSASNNSTIATEGLPAYTGGLNILIKPRKRLSVGTGVYYAKHEIQNKISSPSIASSDLVMINYTYDPKYEFTSNNYATIDEASENTIMMIEYSTETMNNIELEEIFNLIEIPVIFKYCLIDRKFDINMIYSIGALYEVSRTLQYDDEIVSIEVTNGYETNQKMNLGNTIGLGLDVPLYRKFIFNIEPQAKYYLLSKNSLFLKDNTNYSLSIMMGIKYLF